MNQNNKILISVVMSVYNSEKYLVEAIESILNQTYTNFEFIIVNDGSTDSSLDIIQEYMEKDERIVLISRENKGLPYSLNEGIEKAKGKYIARMDADDISLPTRFEKQIEFMQENQDIGVCGTWAEVFGDNRKNRLLKHPINHDELKVRLLFSVCFAHPTVMIRKSVLDKYNLKYNLEYINAQDYELWSRISNFTNMANIPKVLLKYRVTENSITSIANNQKKELRYKLLSDVFKKVLESINIKNSEEENRLHFTIGLNERILKKEIDLNLLGIYISKIIQSNKKTNTFNEDYLIEFLCKKFLISAYYTIQKKDFQVLNILSSKYFYIGVMNIFKGKIK